VALSLYVAGGVALVAGLASLTAADTMLPLPAVIAFALAATFGAGAALLNVVQLYLSWDQIQDGHARLTPLRAAGPLLVPLFNCYWLFPALTGLAHDLNAYVGRHQIAARPVSPALCRACCITACLVPLTLGLALLPCVILLNVALRALKDAAVAIAADLRSRTLSA
jgi:hypothetical protein